MKYCIYAFLFFFQATGFAQTPGKITFEEKMDLHKSLPPDREQFKDMIPQYRSSFFELVYAENESIYQPRKEEEITQIESDGPGSRMMMRFGRDNRIVYKNLPEQLMIDSREFMQKQFLITGPPTPRKWKIGTRQKTILGYNCLEASHRADSATAMVVWFAPAIPVANGPSDYQGLPGMILQVDINQGSRMITATEIKLTDVDVSGIQAPKKGKEVTAEEFEKIREEKMKEMGAQQGFPGGGRHMMIIRE